MRGELSLSEELDEPSLRGELSLADELGELSLRGELSLADELGEPSLRGELSLSLSLSGELSLRFESDGLLRLGMGGSSNASILPQIQSWKGRNRKLLNDSCGKRKAAECGKAERKLWR